MKTKNTFNYSIFIFVLLIFNSINSYSQCWNSISGGTQHTLAIKSDGTLWSWGDNSGGQLGDGSTISRSNPVQISTRKDWKSISAGFAHSVGLTTDGTLFTWGFNTRGQLGNGTESMQVEPKSMSGKWKAIAAGGSHTLAIKEDGTLWAWGNNERAQAGRTDGQNQLTPVQISSATNWVDINAGYYEGIALNNKGEIWGWGHAGKPEDRAKLAIPAKIGSDNDWKEITAGLGITVALKNNGTIWSWESPAVDVNTGLPYWEGRIKQVGTESTWNHISAGYNYALATQTNGTLWAWGTNSNGQLGDGYTGTIAYSPQQIETDTNWLVPVAGDFHALALNQSQELFAWGNNSEGQLNLVTNNEVLLPKKTTCPASRIGCWKSVSVSSLHTLALKDDGTLWTWGRNTEGQLGIGSSDALGSSVPVQVKTTSKWKSIHAVANHNLAIKDDGTLWTWGNNTYGQLGNGTTTDSYEPIPVVGLSDIAFLSGNAFESLVYTNSGNVYAWGNNTYGQLGNGQILPYQDFVDKPMLSHNMPWKSISMGLETVYALHQNGTIWHWGDKITGTPTLFNAETDWKIVKASSGKQNAIKNDGTLWHWGKINYTLKLDTPTKVGSDVDWDKVSVGLWQTLLIKKDGTLWGYGNFSDPNNKDFFIENPTQIGVDSDWKEVYTTISRNCALKKDGTLWCWGNNDFGALGDGTTAFKSEPTLVSSGCDEYTLSVNHYTDNNELSLFFPNPVVDVLHVNSDLYSSASVYDFSGRLIKIISVVDRKIDLTDLKTGIYIVKWIGTNQSKEIKINKI